ncbi:phage holin family protein [Salininema proteolyticum]|uniref:Phage holin family protein n=1 Tax=Salininema proteolyticum TaxID=1607685 RepID=A0ABV8TX26_9ACTN
MKLLVKILVTGLAVAIVSWLLPGIDMNLSGAGLGEKILTIIVIGGIFGLVNAVLKPIIKVVGCGFYVLTLGLFALVVNGGLFYLTAWVAKKFDLPFSIDNFGWAILGALLVSIVVAIINAILPDKVASE